MALELIKVSDFPKIDNPNGAEWFPLGLPDGTAVAINIDDFKTYMGFAASANYKGNATPSTDPGTPAGPEFYTATEVGTYTNFGGIEVEASDAFVLLSYDGANWSKAVANIDLSIYAKADEVAKKVNSADLFDGINQYNYLNDVDGFYIETVAGILHADPDSSVSEEIACVPGQIIYIVNRTGNGGFRFLDSGGNPMLPLHEDDSPFSTYSDLLNGAYKAPVGAVSYQFTTQFNGVTNRENIVASDSPSGQLLVKEALLPTPSYIPTMQGQIDDNALQLQAIQSEIPVRVNMGENTDSPAAFPTAADGANSFGVELLADTGSPAASIIGWKRRFFNTDTPDGATCFRTWLVPLGSSRPNTISFAFWTKRAQFEAAYSNNYLDNRLGVRRYEIDPSLVLAGTPQSDTGELGTTMPEYDTATLTVSLIAEVGDYIRLRFTYSNIVWKPGFAGTTILHYYTYSGATFFEKEMEFIDFTVLFNAEPEGIIIYPGPNGEYPSNVITLPSLEAEIQAIKQQVGASSLAMNVLFRNNTDLYLSTPWDGTRNLVRRMDVFRPNSFDHNPNANFVSPYLAAKGGDQTVQLLSLKSANDDITPANLNGSYIGGNHGWNHAEEITAMAHGKTVADVGSIYVDTNGRNFTIMRVDVDTLWLLSENLAVDGYSYSFAAPVGDLTYVSDGVNTATISGYSVATLGNMRSSISQAVRSILLDGETSVTGNGDYVADFVDVRETYDALDLVSIRERITSQRPVGGYTEQPNFNELGADKLFTHSIVYRFLSNGTTLVLHNFRTWKKVSFNFHGFIQSQPLNTGADQIYIPKSLPISDGVTNYDFRQVTDWNADPAASLYLTPAYWEDPLSPPDRVVNKNANVVVHVGYLTDRGIGLNRKDHLDEAIFLSTARKIYPMADSIVRAIEANQSISCAAFRQFLNPSGNPAGRTNYAWFELDGVVWIFLDYHGALNDSITPKSDWIGRKIEVVESNMNVIMLADVVADTIEVVSTASAASYGFAVLKII